MSPNERNNIFPAQSGNGQIVIKFIEKQKLKLKWEDVEVHQTKAL